jgi:uncharacterized protein
VNTISQVVQSYSSGEMIWIAAALFLMGVSKGGIPVGQIALQMLILFWPGEIDPARTAIAFMLPSLCVMDLVAVFIYRRHIDWSCIRPLLGWTLLGVVIASVAFVSRGSSLVVPDRWIKLAIGFIGLLFVFYQLIARRLLARIAMAGAEPSGVIRFATGFSAGIISTLAHAAGPILQMYLLPRNLPKLTFTAVSAVYFCMLNITKMVPFTISGRIEPEHYILTLCFLPLIPVGVLVGVLLIHVMRQKHFNPLIYGILFLTSINLIWRALG